MAVENKDLIFIETKGFSMWPFLRGKEKLIIRKIPMRNLRLGDLILYKANNQLVCHRLARKIETNNGCLIYSRGDTSFAPGERVNEEMYLGKVVSIIKNNKVTSLEGFMQKPVNRINLLVLPLFNFMFKQCYKIFIKLNPLKR